MPSEAVKEAAANAQRCWENFQRAKPDSLAKQLWAARYTKYVDKMLALKREEQARQ